MEMRHERHGPRIPAPPLGPLEPPPWTEDSSVAVRVARAAAGAELAHGGTKLAYAMAGAELT